MSEAQKAERRGALLEARAAWKALGGDMRKGRTATFLPWRGEQWVQKKRGAVGTQDNTLGGRFSMLFERKSTTKSKLSSAHDGRGHMKPILRATFASWNASATLRHHLKTEISYIKYRHLSFLETIKVVWPASLHGNHGLMLVASLR